MRSQESAGPSVWSPSRLLVAGALSLALGFGAVRASVVSLAAYAEPSSVEGVEALMARLPSNAGYRHLMGKAELVGGRAESAVVHLESGVRLNPLSAQLWVDLARARLNVGDRAAATQQVLNARRRDPTNGGLCYEGAMVLLEAGSVGDGLAALRCVADLTPGRAVEVYDLAWAMVGDGEVIRSLVVPDTAEGWRNYGMYTRGRRNDEVTPAWQGLSRYAVTRSDRLDYVDYLAWFGRSDEAQLVWAEEFGVFGSNRAFNGSFESPPVGRGFGWVIEPADGVRTRVLRVHDAAEGDAVLRISFEGGNPDYHHVHEIVPVEPGRRHVIRARVRCLDLTSASGPRFVVEGYGGGCGMRSVQGREWLGTNAWTDERVEFVPPPGCSVVKVSVQRAATARFDGSISGDLDVDRLEVVVDDLST